MKKAYFIGIGGIGMSALAQYFKAKKWAVSGSDAAGSPTLAILKKARISAEIGHKRGNLPAGTDLVVTTQAIPSNNPELREARQRGIRVLTYPDAIAELTEQYRTVAVAGAHGKSTTTALAALALIRGGLDPTVIVGTMLREFGGRNFRAGRGKWFVLEADEFGNAFRRYSPTLAIVTNIDREHLDTFKNLAGIKKAFIGFMENVASGGTLILNRDDRNLRSLRTEIAAMEKRRGARVVWYSIRGARSAATVRKIRRAIRIPGEHNTSNAMAAYKLGRALGIPEKKILAAIGAYRGAWRRMEYRGRFGGGARRGGAPVYDDYAHHPTEIRATLGAFREKYPGKKILCVFQPHLARRLESLFADFTTAFADADETLILPLYKVAGRHTPPGRYDSAALVRAIQKREPKKRFFYLANPRNLKNAIIALSRPDGSSPLSRKIIVMMGAGDVVNYTADLLGKNM